MLSCLCFWIIKHQIQSCRFHLTCMKGRQFEHKFESNSRQKLVALHAIQDIFVHTSCVNYAIIFLNYSYALVTSRNACTKLYWIMICQEVFFFFFSPCMHCWSFERKSGNLSGYCHALAWLGREKKKRFKTL